jgi:hypothetical protein
MTYQELARDYGEEVASRMFTIMSLESKGRLIQDLLDFMGKKVLDKWAIAISKEVIRESA